VREIRPGVGVTTPGSGATAKPLVRTTPSSVLLWSVPMRPSLSSAFLLSAIAAASALGGCEPSSAAPDEVHASSAQRARDGAPCTEIDGVPSELRCAGLYSDWATRTIDPDALPYAPGFALWSDGADKSRWVRLPPSTTIDVGDMNGWVFPVGTRFFKEFRLTIDGQPRVVETRMLWKRAVDRWDAVKYVWSEAQDSAVRVEDAVKPFPDKTDYEAPSEGTCTMCHRGARDQILGFGAILLAAPEATGLAYEALRERALVGADAPPAAALQIPGDPVAREALGRLHVGCGVSCHGASGPRIKMRIDVKDGHAPSRVEETALFKSGVGRRPGFGAAPVRITPGDETASALFLRMASPDYGKMPPVATRLRDEAGLEAVRAFIRALPPP
jgi:hypothetical protein